MVADSDVKNQSPLIALFAGGIAGGIESLATYPFEFAKTRVQLYGHGSSRNPFKVVATVYTEEGLRALYKGCTTLIVKDLTVISLFKGSIGKDAVRFMAFDRVRSMFEDPMTHTLTPARSIASGMAAGVAASVLAVTPSERIKTALIDDAKTSQRFRSPLHCVSTLAREQGLRRALYAGFVTTTLKQVGTTGFRLGSYSIIKDAERLRGIPVDHPATVFANGAVAGTVTTLATQPFDTVKTAAQQARRVGTADAVRAIYAEAGVRGFWRGTVMRLGRTVMAGGILFSANEQATKVLKVLMGHPTSPMKGKEEAR